MVVAYHVWFGRVSGGVDVFLLISAFLLTGSFLRRIEREQPLRVPQYWLHAFSRLVPPAAVVIALTAIAGFTILPISRARGLLEEAVASALYAQNWLLAARSVDYYAADHSLASPLQHFWSLAIQGQVFVLWPLLLLLAALVVRLTKLRPAVVVAALFGAIAIASLTYAQLRLPISQAFTYFDTAARLWEFALGSLLACALPLLERRRSESPSPVRALQSWAGLGAMLACGWAVDVAGAFPGAIALWPLLAACLVLAAGRSGTRWGADALLSSPPVQRLGGISYALYLVHWPLLVIALHLSDRSQAGALLGTAVVLVSILLAWALTRGVDSPLRRSAWISGRWWRGAGLIALSWALVLGIVVGGSAVLDQRAREAVPPPAAADPHPGAASLLPSAAPVPTGVEPIPALSEIRGDTVGWAGNCPESMPGLVGDLREFCTVVPTGAPADAPLVIIAGNSHALQAQPMLQEHAREQGWRLISVARPQCSFGVVSSVPWCGGYNSQVIELLKASEADALVTLSTFGGQPGQTQESVAEGFEEAAQQVLDAGIPILALRDNPRLTTDFVACAEERRPCSVPVSASLAAEDPAEVLARTLPISASSDGGDDGSRARMTQIDLTDAICPAGRCVPVVGNVYTYIDDNHLSAAYSATLAPALAAEAEESGFRLR